MNQHVTHTRVLRILGAVALLLAVQPAKLNAGGAGRIGDPRYGYLIALDYEVYELVPGCTKFEIGDIVTLYQEEPAPYETTVGGTGPCAGTKVRMVPQR